MPELSSLFGLVKRYYFGGADRSDRMLRAMLIEASVSVMCRVFSPEIDLQRIDRMLSVVNVVTAPITAAPILTGEIVGGGGAGDRDRSILHQHRNWRRGGASREHQSHG
jgi:hypothetical protein